MSYELDNYLVVGVSSRALFDLEEENRIFEEQGVKAYADYQIRHENDILKPGTAFPLIKALLRLNELEPGIRRTEVVIMSRNSADTSLRIFHSAEHYGLDITRATLSGGASISPYLNAFRANLFLSASEEDVKRALNAGIAAGIVCSGRQKNNAEDAEIHQIRIAFDGDAVLFSDEAEKIYQSQGLDAFKASEKRNADKPLPPGPFAKFIKTLTMLQEDYPPEHCPIRTALVTARNAPSHERVIKTLRQWNVRVDEVFFLGGVTKKEILSAFGAHIFFDDQEVHTKPASEVVPAARVPYID